MNCKRGTFLYWIINSLSLKIHPTLHLWIFFLFIHMLCFDFPCPLLKWEANWSFCQKHAAMQWLDTGAVYKNTGLLWAYQGCVRRKRRVCTQEKKGFLTVFRAALVAGSSVWRWCQPWCSKWKAVFWRTLFPSSALCIGGWRELSMYVGWGLFLLSLFFLLEETELEFKNSRKHVSVCLSKFCLSARF